MVRKFFPLDKNYLLEEAQIALRERLFSLLIDLVKEEYELRYNPLGLCDDLILKVRDYKPANFDSLANFYDTLAGVYRYKFGDNQLEFIWDGDDQMEKYKKEWSMFFMDQAKKFCSNDLFIKAVFDLTIFNNYSQLSENRMNNFMLQTFEVKLSKGSIRVA